MAGQSDWCTLWPEGWWGYCCEAHDKAYGAQIVRAVADRDLFQCVAHSLPAWADGWGGIAAAVSVVVGGIMYAGVRLFGAYFFRRAGK